MTADRMWWVTPTTRPDKRLAGPYDSLDAALKQCLLMVSRQAAVSALADGKLPAYYTPRQFECIDATYMHIQQHMPARESKQAKPAVAGHLPDVVYTYTEGDLRVLCRALDLPAPAGTCDRAAIIMHMEHELTKLHNKVKT